ncbi:MAG TPA: sigma-70 family RNA polymerase sigma factor [Pilimelia sp.]|nr:sigma-70 family RNA polymerase sigma factor [Pilimelia sp.]
MHPDHSTASTSIGGGPGIEANAELAALDQAAREYAASAGAGRDARRTDLVVATAPLARRLARRYRGRGEALEDLEQVALLGALKAVDGYEPERGMFSGYLLATVSGELKKHFRDRGWGVRAPRRVQELALQVMHTTAQLTAERAARPTAAEVAGVLGVPTAEVSEAMMSASAYRPVSLNAPLPGDDGAELGDTLGGTDTELGRVDDRLTVAALLCKLPARERQVLAMRFYGNRTQSEIAEALGMSQMHASRLIAQALGWLREAMLSESPRHWRAGRAAPDGTGLGVRTRAVPGAVVMELVGEVERDNVEQLRRAVAAALRLAPVPELRVDLRNVPFVDAAAIAALIWAHRVAGRAGRSLRIVGARPYVGRLLATAGLWPLLDRSPQAPAGASSVRSRAQTTLPPATGR